ncbi:cytochrome b [Providencia vermicola]|uniref:cytochrome b n=1 Tax=Providencia vermicola TaxID=333965 RepID=UPI0024AC657A
MSQRNHSKIAERTAKNSIFTIFKAIPLPKTTRGLWFFGIGTILLLMLLVQIISGVILAMFYAPTAELAFDSIIHIVRNVNQGELVRNMHTIGASLFFAACYIHMFRGMYYSVYRRPYIKMWMVSVTLYVLLMVTAFLGYSLIWGQKSYWAATVMTEFSKAIPFVGGTIHEYVVGGFSAGTPMIGRFFVLHFIIPFIIVIFTIIHIRTVKQAFAKAIKQPFTEKQQQKLLFNFQITNDDMIKTTIFCMVFVWFLFFAPQYLMHADNFIKADPTVTPEIVAPEWYFLMFFSILRCFPNELVGLVAMFAAMLVFYFLPWLDNSKSRFRHYHPIIKTAFWLWVANAMLLTWLGSKALTGPDLINVFSENNQESGWVRPLSQASTLIYFAYFFIVLPSRRYIEVQD